MEISAVIAATSKEKKNLDDLRENLKGFANEVVVFDIDPKTTPYVELVRNKMIEKASSPWVLILDPDESLLSSLKKRLKQVVKEDKYDVVNIPRKNIFFGRWIRHTNWWPDRHVRFFKKGKVFWTKFIHKYPEVSGRQLNLPASEDLAIIHHGYDSLGQFWRRQLRYSDIEAQNRLEEGERPTFIKLFWWPLREFLARYIKHKGFLDGFYGAYLVFVMMIYKVMVWVKMQTR